MFKFPLRSYAVSVRHMAVHVFIVLLVSDLGTFTARGTSEMDCVEFLVCN